MADNFMAQQMKCVHVGAANAVTGEHRSYWSLLKTYLGTKNFNSLSIIGKNRAVCGYHLGHLVDHPQLIRSALEAITDLYRQGKIKPQIDSVWSFDDVSNEHCEIILRTFF